MVVASGSFWCLPALCFLLCTALPAQAACSRQHARVRQRGSECALHSLLRHMPPFVTAPPLHPLPVRAEEERRPLEELPLGAVVKYDAPLRLRAHALEGPCELVVPLSTYSLPFLCVAKWWGLGMFHRPRCLARTLCMCGG